MTDSAAPSRRRLLYYAHHHGSGHLRHAERLARLDLAELVVVGTGAGRLPGGVELPPDDLDPHREPEGSPFHWTPRSPAVRRRMAAFHAALEAHDPELVVVDVSVEAAAFAALAGYRVAVRRMPGDRRDRPHELAYDLADRLLAYYPESVEDPAFARERAGRCSWLGMPAPAAPDPALEAGLDPAHLDAAEGAVVVLSGRGGDGVPAAELARAAAATPGRRWAVLGAVHGAAAELAALPNEVDLLGDQPAAPFLARAAAIVAGAGANTVADVAAAGRPLVLVPEPRPHREQAAFAERLAATFGTPTAPSWAAASWPELLERAEAADPDALARGLLVSEREYGERFREAVELAVGADVAG